MNKPRFLLAAMLAGVALITPPGVIAAAKCVAEAVQVAGARPFELAQARQCSQRIGPFASQSTAWQRWRQARGQGYAVSDGVFPCYDGYGTRGYCFNVFYRC